MNTKKHLEFIIKANNKTITKEDLETFITLIFQDNIFKIESLPSLTFASQKHGYGGYKHNPPLINLDIEKFYQRIKEGKISIIRLVYSLGHELKHHLQYSKSFNSELFSKCDKDYILSIEKALDEPSFLDKAIINFLDSFNQLSLEEIESIKSISKLPHLKIWLDKFSNNKIRDIRYLIEESFYTSSLIEEDAIKSGVLFAKTHLKKYLKTTNSSSLKEYIGNLEKDVDEVLLVYKIQKDTLSNYYKDFQKFLKALSMQDINEILSIKNYDKSQDLNSFCDNFTELCRKVNKNKNYVAYLEK